MGPKELFQLLKIKEKQVSYMTVKTTFFLYLLPYLHLPRWRIQRLYAVMYSLRQGHSIVQYMNYYLLLSIHSSSSDAHLQSSLLPTSFGQKSPECSLVFQLSLIISSLRALLKFRFLRSYSYDNNSVSLSFSVMPKQENTI